MSVPEGIGSGESPGLFASLRSFWSVLVAILYTRLDLATSELEDEGIRLLKLLLAGLVGILCLLTAFFWAMFFILALVWNTEYVLPVLGLIFALYFIVGIGLLFIARNMILSRPKFLSQTLAELRRDVEGLRQAVVIKKEEPKVMSEPLENLEDFKDFAERRRHLVAEIARQRGELAEAYRNIEKPIHYAEYGLRGFGFLRKNPWVIAAVPAVFSIGSTLLGLKQKKSLKPAPSQRQGIENRPKGLVGHAVKWGGHGWRLFKLYRRVRTYFP